LNSGVDLKSMNSTFWKEPTGRAHLKRVERSLVCDRRSLVFADVYGLPLALNDSVADLCGGFSFAGLFVRIQIFANADPASGAMFADEAIEKAFVALAAIAMAVARFLVQNFLHMGREGVGILR
jgi:hypothetical protein